MKAPVNTDNWSGSIKSDKAPLNTDDWNGFISAEMSRKLSQNCQCVTTPCNCGAVYDPTISYDPTIRDTMERDEVKLEQLSKSREGFSLPYFGKYSGYLYIGVVALGGYLLYRKFKK